MNDPRELSIGELFGDRSSRYVIPIYQRAYAWGDREITQLLEDVWDTCMRGRSMRYYIGSMVVHENGGDDPDRRFEVVDGQQRLTTLFLIMCAVRYMRGELGLAGSLDEWPSAFSLEFDCRPESTDLLQSFKELDESTGDRGAPQLRDLDERFGGHRASAGILAGFRVVCQWLRQCGAKGHGMPDLAAYLVFLRDNVIIFRSELPKSTDLNHYFEVMNTRGEQLEAHEIVKARLMNQLGDATDRRTAFSTMWDMCANMGCYVQSAVDPGIRGKLFGDDWCSLPTASDLPELRSGSGCRVALRSAWDILITKSDDVVPARIDHDANAAAIPPDDDDLYRSIITFPTFLLIVLNLFNKTEEGGSAERISLDDKMLLDSFDSTLLKSDGENAADRVMRFAKLMLRCRFLLDNYIIKTAASNTSADDSNWILQRYVRGESKGRPTGRLLASYGEQEADQHTGVNWHVRMLQSMLQVTYTAQSDKQFVADMLDELLGECKGASGDWRPDGSAFLGFLQRYVRDRVRKLGGGDYNGLIDLGVDTPHLLLNYIDYALWAMMNGHFDGVAGSEHADDLKQWFGSLPQLPKRSKADFRFRYRSTVEHFYPQHPVTGEHDGVGEAIEELPAETVDRIGNLCMMTRSENSLRSNLPPMAKLKAFDVPSQSLKFQFMADAAEQAGTWRKAQIDEATERIRTLLAMIFGQSPA